MIRKPKVGMRVRASQDAPYKKGKAGSISTVDGTSRPRTMFDCGNEYWIDVKYLTEIKESDMKTGDLVTIIDGSWAVELKPSNRFNTHIGLCRDTFTVLSVKHTTAKDGHHDIIIKNNSSGDVFLHSSSLCSIVEPKPKEKQYCEYCGKKL